MSRFVMQYLTLPKFGASIATVMLLGSVSAHAAYLAAPAGPAAEHLDAGLDQSSSYARHGNSRGGASGAIMNAADVWYSRNATRTQDTSQFQVRVNAGPQQSAISVDLMGAAPAPIALRSATLNKAAVVLAPAVDPVTVASTFVAALTPVVTAPSNSVPAPAAQTVTPAQTPTQAPGDSASATPQSTAANTPAVASVEPAAVPEPGSFALLGLGLLALARRRSRS